MSEGEEWRRELAEKLHPNTDWTVRPVSHRGDPPIIQMLSIQEGQVPPLLGMASTGRDVAVTVDRAASAVYPHPAPIVAPTRHNPGARIWPYVAVALALLATTACWLFIHRVREPAVAPATANVAAAPVAVAAPVRPALQPANIATRCDETLAAPVLSALVRRGTAFDGQEAHATAPATLGAVRQLTADGSTAVCHGVLELQLADVRAGLRVVQIVSGPVDYAVDGGAGASMPTFRVLRARSISYRLATMASAAPVVVAAAAPVAVVPAPGVVEHNRSIRVAPAVIAVRPPARPAVVEQSPSQRAAAVTAALPETAGQLSPGPAKADAMVSPAADDDVTPDVTRPPDERATDSAAAQALYGAIARSGDPQSIGAADEGRDLYVRQSQRCATPACAAAAYKRWLTQLRDINERSRISANY